MDYLYFQYIEFLKNYNISPLFGDITFFILPFCIIVFAILLLVLILVLIERKLLAYFTQRKGPNRVGYWGLLQTLADAVKLLLKENITPESADKFLFNLAPVVIFVPVICAVGILPFCAEFKFVNSYTNAILYIVLVTFPILSIFLAGWASNNKYSLLGAVRAVSQILSYELPICFVLISVIVLSSSMNLNNIIMSQYSMWFVVPCFAGFVVMFIAVLAELNRCPFDLPEAESELICGYNTEYSGMRFAVFYLSEYTLLFANAVFLSVIFFGGYLPPFNIYLSNFLGCNYSMGTILIYFEQVFWLILKSCLIIFVIMWIRATLPRLASFDLIRFSWCFLLPISILNLFFVIIYKIYIGGVIG